MLCLSGFVSCSVSSRFSVTLGLRGEAELALYFSDSKCATTLRYAAMVPLTLAKSYLIYESRRSATKGCSVMHYSTHVLW